MLSRYALVLLFLASLGSCKSVMRDIATPLEDAACRTLRQGFVGQNMRSRPLPENFVSYRSRDFESYCREALLNSDDFSHPGKSSEANHWVKSVGSSVRLFAINQLDLPMPYVTMVRYKEADGCQLGMRVFIEDLAQLKQDKLKPFIFIHGGAWQYRAMTSSLAVDMLVPHLTSRGYVVFSPFYRLLGKAEGSRECQQANGSKIQEDMRDAFAWVKAQLKDYGVNPQEKIRIGGQSAGAHLATYLLTEYPQEIAKALLFYPVTDFKYMIENVLNGDFSFLKDETAVGLYIEGQKAKAPKLETTHPLVLRNSFPDIIHQKPQSYPPVFIFHGTKDFFVPIENSARLCAAYNHDQVLPTKFTAPWREQPCGPHGRLYPIEGGSHMLDLRCFTHIVRPFIPAELGKSLTCAPGSEENGQTIEKSFLNLMQTEF